MENLKKRLLSIRKFEFHASTKVGAQGWEGTGQGQVIAQMSSPDVLLLQESGYFSPPVGKAIKCSNVYRWTFGAETVKLEHLRFGAQNPVYLFDMALLRADEWTSVCPHLCDRDLYEAKLWLTETHIQFDWRVHGAEKDEQISYHYQ